MPVVGVDPNWFAHFRPASSPDVVPVVDEVVYGVPSPERVVIPIRIVLVLLAAWDWFTGTYRITYLIPFIETA